MVKRVKDFRWRFILITLMTLSLSACTLKIGYSFLDWFILKTISRYVDFNAEQKKSVKKSVKNFHQWHRQTELPRYSNFIETFRDSIISEKLTRVEKSTHQLLIDTENLQALIDRSIEKILPDALSTLSSLSDDQVSQVIKEFKKNHQNFYKEHIEIKPAKLYKDRAKRFRKSLKRWMAPLNKQQKRLITQWSETVLPYETILYEQQGLWIKHFEKVLKKRDDTGYFSTQIRLLMYERVEDWPIESQAVMNKNRTTTLNLLSALLESLDSRQISQTYKKLNKYIKTFEDLSSSHKTVSLQRNISPMLSSNISLLSL